MSNAVAAPFDLEEFLSKRGCSASLKQGLEITPALKGSGHTDISVNHDELLDKQPSECSS